MTTPVTRHLTEVGPDDERPPLWLDLLEPINDARISRFSDIWVWTALTEFQPWAGVRPDGLESDCRKRDSLVLGPDGQMSCAEIEVVRRIRSRRWSAGWLATCGRRNDVWRDLMLRVRTPMSSVLPPVRNAPDEIRSVLESGGRAGYPDVVAWIEPAAPVFVEVKGPGDTGHSQVPWLAQVWGQGHIGHADFVLLRWDYPRRSG